MMRPSWFPPAFQKCTCPILKALNSPGEFDLCGSAFLIKRNDADYVVTAKHVIEGVENPRIGYSVYGEQVRAICAENISKNIPSFWGRSR